MDEIAIIPANQLVSGMEIFQPLALPRSTGLCLQAIEIKEVHVSGDLVTVESKNLKRILLKSWAKVVIVAREEPEESELSEIPR